VDERLARREKNEGAETAVAKKKERQEDSAGGRKEEAAWSFALSIMFTASVITSDTANMPTSTSRDGPRLDIHARTRQQTLVVNWHHGEANV